MQLKNYAKKTIVLTPLTSLTPELAKLKDANLLKMNEKDEKNRKSG